MTLRKPGNVNWEDWVDQQINQATMDGQFDNLPGQGKPIPGLDQPYDDMWWVKQKINNEKLDATPPILRVRAEVEKFMEAFLSIYSEAALRRAIHELNHNIQVANKGPLGPMQPQQPLDVEMLCQKWRQQQQ